MKIYQLTEATPKRVQMMSYIFQGDDGSLAVMDGGNWGDGEHLFAALQAVSGCEHPHILAWLMTHAHLDHVDAFRAMMENHAGEWTLDKLYYSFPEQAYFDKYEPSEAHTLREMTPLLSGMEPALLHQVEMGETIEVDGMRFTVLQTPDSIPTSNVINNASVVYRLEGSGVSALFLGDLGVEGGQRLLSMYGDGLKCDMVQMAHHGQNGVDRPVYEAVSPAICLWPTPPWLWDNNPGGGYNTGFWKTIIVQGWMKALGVERHVITKDGVFCMECRDGAVRVEKISFTT